MTGSYSVVGIAKADFLERVRKFSFAAFTALLVFTVFWFVPRPSGFTALVIEPNQFLQGSDPSWVPMSSAMCGGMLLCLLGFAYLKNTVQHDSDIGILCLVRTSPLKRSIYLFGKLLANVLLLLVFLCAMMAASLLTMILRFPGKWISISAFLSPFLCVIPGLFFVAALALFTDCAPVFRRNSSLSIAVFICLFILVLTLGSLKINPNRLISILDASGYLWMKDSISAAAASVTGNSAVHISVFTASHAASTHLKSLVFGGLAPSISYFLDKVILFVISLFFTYFASLMLPKTERIVSTITKVQDSVSRKHSETRIPNTHFGLIHSELVILLKGLPLFWWITTVCLWAANLFSPMDTVESALVPLAFAWMLPVFSKMGCLEHQSGMEFLLRTIPKARIQQTIFCWYTGLALSFFTTMPVLLRLLFSGCSAGFLSLLVVTVFIPTMALFLGEWTKTNRPFEILFLIFCLLIMNDPSIIFPGNYFSVQSALRVMGFVIVFGATLFLTFAKIVAPHPKRIR